MTDKTRLIRCVVNQQKDSQKAYDYTHFGIIRQQCPLIVQKMSIETQDMVIKYKCISYYQCECACTGQ